MKFLIKLITWIVALCVIFAIVTLHREINTKVSPIEDRVVFQIEQGQSLTSLSNQLEERGIVRFAGLFAKYMQFRGVDTKMQPGGYGVEPPITLKKVVDVIENTRQNREEMELTLLPGWTLRDIRAYFVEAGLGTEQEVSALLGKSATYGAGSFKAKDIRILKEKPSNASLEGYLAPETIRFFTDATLEQVVERFVRERDKQITDQMWEDLEASGRNFHQVLTMAGLVQKEVRLPDDKAKVADLFWRRYDAGWGMQADSTVHYIFGSDGSTVFTTAKQRDVDSSWNTYKYNGLPPGPISTPNLAAINAALYPEANSAWYFLTTLDTGAVKYADTLEGHNRNVRIYLR